MTVAMVDEMIWDGISLGMAKLTRKQRIILINHFLLDIPAKDLAVQLGIKLSSLYTTKNKGVRGLYKFLKKNRSVDSKTGIPLRSIIKHPDNNSTQQYEV
jgi:hypothetical protein